MKSAGLDLHDHNLKEATMKTITTISELRAVLAKHRAACDSIGFVPTMGYLHDGHLTLAHTAQDANDVVVVSTFVNPIQFGPTEDYETYPRDLDRDRALLETTGVDYLFAPSPSEMYPQRIQSYVEVPTIGGMLEGAVRPAYFRGVATVVSKLFNIVAPTRAYFGEKDYQQILVIKQFVKDLSYDIEIVAVPTVREADGLAMSSRNVYLTEQERRAALRLNLALKEAREYLSSHRTASVQDLETHLIAFISKEALARVDLVAVRDADTLAVPSAGLPQRTLVLLFVRFGKAQLLDQTVIDRKEWSA